MTSDPIVLIYISLLGMIEAVITMLTKRAPEVEKEPDPDLVIVLAEMGFDPEVHTLFIIYKPSYRSNIICVARKLCFN